MLSCAACAAPLPERASFCPACGGAAASGRSPTSSLETAPARPGRLQISRGSGAPQGAGLAPGTVLAGRYRIAGLLGRGGMGEVYRAEDLVLGQDVALKFLSKELETDPDALERLLSEVRNARQISHPHVCRVHDVGQAGDRHFLTMEYVDGEDLSTLLHRIGRLPAKKAVEVARQICAGLSAVHEKGVVHRDLKPGNVMLDGHGRVRITDFGLAVAGSHAAGEIAGTPAYMAPEQLAGEPATPRTDLYALGLLLYEIFTGVRPFEAASFAEWREVHSRQLPAPPGSHVGDLDPAVERIVLRCLEKDPARRPSKASAVALALPGGDPLAAALAAGETPPPELVAASSAGAALRPGAAAAVFVAVVLALLGLSVGSRCNLFRRVPFEKPAEALADRASALIAESGYLVRATDSAWGFELDQSWLGATEDPMPAPARWGRIETGQPLTYGFWYRQSPVPLEPESFGGNRGEISRLDPPARVSGMASVLLDPRGRLVELHVVPQETAPPAGSPAPAEPGWERLFVAAGLDLGRFTPVAPRWSPPGFADARAAWQGTYADHSDLPIRVEAASFLGRPVYFRVVAPWDQPPLAASDLGSGARAAGIVGLVLVLTVLLGAAV
ncbi:MAG: protein kinase, partial [Acidobacteria bacterium]|nr:protein kinase [Acidobacteriota bacterium]